MGNVYTVNGILFGALSDRPAPDRNIILYIDKDTGKASLSNGTSWNDFGGASYPGVTSNGAGGLTAPGSQDLGDPHATVIPSFLSFYGYCLFVDTIANYADGDPVVNIVQAQTVSTANGYEAFGIKREGSVSAHDYVEAAAYVQDDSDSAQPLQRWTKGGVTQAQVDGDGFRVHGKFKTGAAVTGTLGAATGQYLPIYDEAGTVIGGIPIQVIS